MREAGLNAGTRVTVLQPDPVFQPGLAMGRQGTSLEFIDTAPCVCAPERPVILALALPETGFWAKGATPPAGTGPEAARIARWRVTRKNLPACRAALEASCAAVLTRAVDGRLVAVLGVSQR